MAAMDNYSETQVVLCLSRMQEEQCHMVFELLTHLSNGSNGASEEGESFSREDLIRAQGGDFKMYEKMVTGSDTGSVLCPAWMAFIRKTFEEKGSKGKKSRKKADAWLRSLLHTLSRSLGAEEIFAGVGEEKAPYEGISTEEAREVEGLFELLSEVPHEQNLELDLEPHRDEGEPGCGGVQ